MNHWKGVIRLFKILHHQNNFMAYIRSFLFHLFFLVVSSLVLVICGSFSFFRPSLAMSGFRFWTKMIVWGLRFFVNMTIEIRGLHHMPLGAALVASKHQSILETVMIFAICKNPAIILKKELTYIPFGAQMIHYGGHIAIDRRKGTNSREKIKQAATEKIKQGRQIFIYPEGTRSGVHSAPTYKRGIYLLYDHLKIPCIPVAVNTGMFWPKNAFLLKSGNVVIEILPPIPAGKAVNPFMTELTTHIESATARLVQEAACVTQLSKRAHHEKEQNKDIV